MSVSWTPRARVSLLCSSQWLPTQLCCLAPWLPYPFLSRHLGPSLPAPPHLHPPTETLPTGHPPPLSPQTFRRSSRLRASPSPVLHLVPSPPTGSPLLWRTLVFRDCAICSPAWTECVRCSELTEVGVRVLYILFPVHPPPAPGMEPSDSPKAGDRSTLTYWWRGQQASEMQCGEETGFPGRTASLDSQFQSRSPHPPKHRGYGQITRRIWIFISLSVKLLTASQPSYLKGCYKQGRCWKRKALHEH